MRWNPTMNFRWLAREVTYMQPSQSIGGKSYPVSETVKILQQGWAPEGGGQVEWRDVPVVSAMPVQNKEPTHD